jgi:hypothetical protein
MVKSSRLYTATAAKNAANTAQRATAGTAAMWHRLRVCNINTREVKTAVKHNSAAACHAAASDTEQAVQQ